MGLVLGKYADIEWKQPLLAEERVLRHMEDQIDEMLMGMVAAMHFCESPIEKLMFIELRALHNYQVPGRRFHITPQKELETPRGLYRLDFLLSEFHPESEEFAGGAALNVECDGHEFHEKSKEQASKDKARDRAVQASGIAVMRFTGSEIYANPRACAKEAIETFLALMDRRAVS